MSGPYHEHPKEPFGDLHPIDVHVGRRLREARLSHRLSQSALARHVGLTFQQIQKYERGTNRISASALWAFAELLGVQPNWFYEGLNGLKSEKISAANDRLPATEEGIETRLLASDLTAEEQTAVQAVIGWLRSRPQADYK